MSKLNLTEFSNTVIQSLDSELKDIDDAKLEIRPEARLSNFNPFLFEPDEKFSKYRFGAIIYREVSWTPTGLDQIEHVERWFPGETDSVEIPVAVVEFTREEPLSSKAAVNQVALEKFAKSEPVLPLQVRYSPYGSPSSSFEKKNGVIYSKVHTPKERELNRSIIEHVKTHIKKYSAEDLIDEFNLEDKVRRSDPEIFYHFNDVLWAYNHNRDNIIVILLSVYFENHVKELLEAYFEDAKANSHVSSFYDNNWGFDRCLKGCRTFGLITDNEFNTINKIREARNDYAHEIESFDKSYTTDAEQEGLIEEAIQLYEDLIGVEKSILNE